MVHANGLPCCAISWFANAPYLLIRHRCDWNFHFLNHCNRSWASEVFVAMAKDGVLYSIKFVHLCIHACVCVSNIGLAWMKLLTNTGPKTTIDLWINWINKELYSAVRSLSWDVFGFQIDISFALYSKRMCCEFFVCVINTLCRSSWWHNREVFLFLKL